MRFSQAMQSVERHGDSWRAQVGEDWLQGRSAFGGLQAALGLRAMRELVSPDMPLRSLQTTFVAPVPAGPVTIRAQQLRAGRSACQVEASLCDGDQTLCRLVAVFGSARPSSLHFQPEQPVVESSASRELRYVEGLTPAFMQHFSPRWLRGDLPFSGGHQRDSVLQVSLRDDGPVDETHVLAFADFIPPIALGMFSEPRYEKLLFGEISAMVQFNRMPECVFCVDRLVSFRMHPAFESPEPMIEFGVHRRFSQQVYHASEVARLDALPNVVREQFRVMRVFHQKFFHD